jgi:hypothetical protein
VRAGIKRELGVWVGDVASFLSVRACAVQRRLRERRD